MKWINQMSDEELLLLHKEAICKDTSRIEVSKTDDSILVSAWEYWQGKEQQVDYLYSDFGCCGASDNNPGFTYDLRVRRYLTKKFGREYFVSLASHITGLTTAYIEEIIDENVNI